MKETSTSRTGYSRTFFTCLVVALLTLPVHAGFFWGLLAIPLLPWIGYSIFIAFRHPSRRRPQLTRVGMWLGTALLVFLIHCHYYLAARSDANQLVAALEQYHQQRGSYPADLNALGFKGNRLRTPGGTYYNIEQGKPRVFYLATQIVFDAYRYDFANKAWVYSD